MLRTTLIASAAAVALGCVPLATNALAAHPEHPGGHAAGHASGHASGHAIRPVAAVSITGAAITPDRATLVRSTTAVPIMPMAPATPTVDALVTAFRWSAA